MVWDLSFRFDVGVYRRTLPLEIRLKVLERDHYTCVYCDNNYRHDPSMLQIDHVIPWSVVKEHNYTNLFAACRDCNSSKSDQTLEDWLGEERAFVIRNRIMDKRFIYWM
jgi:5-methylcytosine-specific restriction endonuclease McrA